MKKWLVALMAALLVLGCTTAALAAEAVNISNQCTWTLRGSGQKYTKLTDGKYTTVWSSGKTTKPYVDIAAPAGSPIGGLYICFATMPSSYEIQVQKSGEWVKYCDGDTRFYHTYVPFDTTYTRVRLLVTMDKAFELKINELFVLSSGDKPDWVQTWEPTPEKADILFLMAHPDDDLIFLGGAIPTYAVEQGRDVVVAYLTYSNTTRRSELLNALWSMGVRTYPVIGTFHDSYTSNAKAAYKSVGGESKVLPWVTELFRRYKPEVVVTHDPNGEYGHGEHKMLADACERCYTLAATEGEYLESFFEYGTWQVKKLYEHLAAGVSQLRFDWSVPLASMGGKTGQELAIEAFEYHVTQKGTKYDVANTGASEQYSNEKFGLVKSEIGPDTRCDDFLEGIYDAPGSYEAVTPAPTPEPTPTPAPWYQDQLPELNEKGYLDEGEFVIANDTDGFYVYIDPTLKVIIQRKFDEAQTLTWFEAEIWTDIEAGERLRTVQVDPDKMSRVHVDAGETARKHNVVFATNGDYYTYRLGSRGSRHIGVEVRDGRLLYDDRYDAPTTVFPNLDTVAFYPDGSMEVAASCEHDGQYYVDRGAIDVYSFGPYLIRDGKLSDRAYTGSETRNPRYALGMVEPGHYVAILAEGRLKRSKGITLYNLALMMREKGCQTAINLDGGQTAVMIFMGKQLNLIGKYDGKTSARKTSEILAVGTSEQVGQIEFK